MRVEICKWYRDAHVPVTLMVDDFCNVWVDTNGNGIIDPGEDWGFAKRGPGSSLVFLEEKILKEFPEVKVTFFVPVGIRSGVIEPPIFPCVSKMINCDAETKAFFKSIGDNPRYEVAYHGTTHGKPGKEAKDFVQEWDTFETLDQAKKSIKAGKEIFKEVFGRYPAGGKYCGYVSNRFSDESIDQSGFAWWCRYSSNSPLTDLDVKYFGNTYVVDIPTTVNGLLLNRIIHPEAHTLKGLLKRILKPLLIKKKLKKIDFLIRNCLVVSIQEHIAYSRVDGKRQMPNIFDDAESIRMILQYLKGQRVWYCTCSELARYVVARDTTDIEVCSEDRFNIRLAPFCVEGVTLTLRINNGYGGKIIQPNGTEVEVVNKLADINVMNGVYALS